MDQIIPRKIIIFEAVKDDKIIDLKFQTNIPADMDTPLIGDDVLLPEKVSRAAGSTKRIFKVISRRFIYEDIPAGIAGVILLTVSLNS